MSLRLALTGIICYNLVYTTSYGHFLCVCKEKEKLCAQHTLTFKVTHWIESCRQKAFTAVHAHKIKMYDSLLLYHKPPEVLRYDHLSQMKTLCCAYSTNWI